MKIRLRFIVLFSFLLILAKREGYAQQDSVVIIGYLVANDSSDLLNFDKTHLSVAHIKFVVSYRDKYAPLVASYHTLNVISTDMDGCFEMKAPSSIFNSNAFISFESNFKEIYYGFSKSDLVEPIVLKVRSNIVIIIGEAIRCRISGDSYIPSRWGGVEEIERRGIDDMLKDIH